MSPLPPADVLNAFGITNSVQNIPGGRSFCFLAGNIVLKPSDNDEESQWVAELLATLHGRREPPHTYHLSRPLSVTEKPYGYVYKGWTASSLLSGKEGPVGHFKEALNVSRAFHQDLARLKLSKPSFLVGRTSRWDEADLVTWDLKSLKDVSNVSDEMLTYFQNPLRDLRQLMHPLLDLEKQVTHCDLTGNILFETEDNLPGIIDMTFYWHPAAYAEAVIVADGLTWHGQDLELIKAYGTDDVRLQLLARALYWRNLTLAIEPDMEWNKKNISKGDFTGPVELLRMLMQSP